MPADQYELVIAGDVRFRGTREECEEERWIAALSLKNAGSTQIPEVRLAVPTDPFREAAERVAPHVGANDATDANLIAAEFAPLAERLAKAEAENRRLRVAIHDTILRPMGVVPDSAVEFWDATKYDIATSPETLHEENRRLREACKSVIRESSWLCGYGCSHLVDQCRAALADPAM